jgi:hypothetical protein
MCDVVLDEVVFETDVLCFVVDQCILRVRNGADVVFLDGGFDGDTDTLNLPEQLAVVDGFACSVGRRVVLGFASEMSHACLWLDAVAYSCNAKCKNVTRARLALSRVIVPLSIYIA